MHFIIWGAGVRGRRVRYYLGERAVAYIDTNVAKQGQMQDGLPILSFADYLRECGGCYREAWIIISPRSTTFIESIVRELEQHGVVQYFRLQDAVASYYEYDAAQMLTRICESFRAQAEIGLRGIDCFHADLYVRLQAQGRQPVIWIPAAKWEQEEARRAALAGWDIRCLHEDDRPRLLDDVALLAQLPNVYATPAI